MTTKSVMTEDEYIDLVGRVQQAMAVEPFRPALADVAVLIAEWRLLRNENDQLRTAARRVLDGWDDNLPAQEDIEALRAALAR